MDFFFVYQSIMYNIFESGPSFLLISLKLNLSDCYRSAILTLKTNFGLFVQKLARDLCCSSNPPFLRP